MPNVPDLTGFTIMLVISTSCLVPLIRFSDRKKRITTRCIIVFLAVGIYLAVVIPEIKTIPSTEDEIVYITDTGEKYHSGNCQHLWKSRIPITLEDAIEKGFTDCLHCVTPAYRTEDIQISFSDLYPKGSLMYTGLAVLAIIAYFGLHFILSCLLDRHKEKQENRRIAISNTNDNKAPLQDTPLVMPVLDNPPERQICEALWRSVAFFRKQTGMSANIDADTYLWATMFYVIAKQIRHQEIVDKIYSHFGSAIRCELQNFDVPCGTPLVRRIDECYTKIEKPLNASGINPRNKDEINQLWSYLYAWTSSNGCQLPNDPSAFYCTVILTRAFVSSLIKEVEYNKPLQK